MRKVHWVLWMALGALADQAAAAEPRFVWIPNAAEGTVSKLDAATGEEVARYATVTHEAVVDVMGVGVGALAPWGAAQQPEGVALDFYGNAWVVNRASGLQPSATRIWNHEPNCVDRDSSGTIDTSREVNGTPGIQLADPTEFFSEADECLAFTVIVGAPNGQAWAVAIDAGDGPGDEGDAWVGFNLEQAFYQLDGPSGALLRRVPPAGASGSKPFRAAIDGGGQLWSPDHCCGAARRFWRIDTATGSHAFTANAPSYACSGAFDVAIDLMGKVWLAGFPCASAVRFDPVGQGWFEAQIPGYYPMLAGGLGITTDAVGNVWMVLRETSGNSLFARIDATSGFPNGIWDNEGTISMGIAVDAAGEVWSANAGSANASRLHIDPVTLEPAPHPVTGNVVDLFPVGPGTESYGDFSGQDLLRVTRPYPAGHIFADDFYSGSTAAWSAAFP